MAWGQLRIVPSADMGDLGPHDGEPSVYEWRWYHSALGLSPWLVLIAAAVGVKANRNYRILLLGAPLTLVSLLYLAVMFGISLTRGRGMTSSSQVQFDLLFHSLAIGVTLLWLAAPMLIRRPATVRILAAVVLMTGIVGLAIVSFGTTSSDEAMMFMAFLGFLSAALVLTPAAAARLCRQSYRPVAFMLWLAMWLIVGGVLAVLGFLAVLLSMNAGPSASELPRLVQQGIAVGAILGVCLYVLHLPYLLLGFASPFFRARLQACLNLRPQGDSESKLSFASVDARP